MFAHRMRKVARLSRAQESDDLATYYYFLMLPVWDKLPGHRAHKSATICLSQIGIARKSVYLNVYPKIVTSWTHCVFMRSKTRPKSTRIPLVLTTKNSDPDIFWNCWFWPVGLHRTLFKLQKIQRGRQHQQAWGSWTMSSHWKKTVLVVVLLGCWFASSKPWFFLHRSVG